jgi:lipoprotein-releasing system ATP-binding protein
MNNLLAVKDLHKSFVEGGNEIHVLRGVNLDLGEGERLAVVGESESVKAPLLHILRHLGSFQFRPDPVLWQRGAGETTKLRYVRFRNRQIGFVFQFHYLLPDFSAWKTSCSQPWSREWNLRRRDAKRKNYWRLSG